MKRLMLRLRQADLYLLLAVWLFLAVAKMRVAKGKGSFVNFGQALDYAICKCAF